MCVKMHTQRPKQSGQPSLTKNMHSGSKMVSKSYHLVFPPISLFKSFVYGEWISLLYIRLVDFNIQAPKYARNFLFLIPISNPACTFYPAHWLVYCIHISMYIQRILNAYPLLDFALVCPVMHMGFVCPQHTTQNI